MRWCEGVGLILEVVKTWQRNCCKKPKNEQNGFGIKEAFGFVLGESG